MKSQVSSENFDIENSKVYQRVISDISGTSNNNFQGSLRKIFENARMIPEDYLPQTKGTLITGFVLDGGCIAGWACWFCTLVIVL